MRGSSIFLVEDEAWIALELQEILAHLGYVVCGTAARGEGTLERILSAAPDAVLMDVRLAGAMSGIDLARLLRERSDVPIIFLTAYSDDALLEEAGPIGPVGYLVKPFQERELHATIQMGLRTARLTRELRDTRARLEERQAELEASEQFIRATIDAAASLIAVVDATGRVISTNAAWRSFAEQNPFSWPATKGLDYLKECEQASTTCPAAAKIAQGIRAVIEGAQERFELEYPCPLSAPPRWFLCRVRRFSLGESLRIFVSHEDITVVHEALEKIAEKEQLLESVVETVPVGLFQMDTHGRAVIVNQKFQEMSGLSREECLGDGWLERSAALVHPEERGRVLSETKSALQERRPFQSEYRLVSKDGSVRWVLAHMTELKGGADGPAGYVGTTTDITVRKMNEQVMEALSAELIALEGSAYLEAATRKLAEILNVEIAFISRFDPTTPNELQTLVLLEDGRLVPNIGYSPKSTPCARVIGGQRYILNGGAQREYPDDPYLSERGIEAYAGERILDPSGRLLGHLGLMSRRPFPFVQVVEYALKIFSIAVSAVLSREHTQRQYTDLFEFAIDALLLTDQEGRIALMNRQAEHLLGWRREELLKQPVERLVPPPLQGPHRAMREAFIQNPNRRLMGGGRPLLAVRKKDGSEFEAEISLAPLETEQGPMIATAIRDVTEHKRAERALAQARANLSDVVEGINQAIVLYDAEDRIAFFNQRFLGYFPWLEGTSLLGMSFASLTRQLVLQAIPGASTITLEATIAERSAHHQRADGSPRIEPQPNGRTFRFVVLPARGGGRVTVVTDITEQLKTEERMRQLQRQDAIGKLTGGMAHDFNNYLGVIINNLELLKEEPLEASILEFADDALTAALRAAELTRSLLAYARRQSLRPQPTNINRSVTSISSLLRRTLGEDINIKASLAEDLWTVKIDAAQLDSCVLNLANNARDAMPHGGDLMLTTRNVQLEGGADFIAGDYVLLEVSDTGGGMSPETLSRAFEPFFTTKGPGHGTGLGLSMVYGFVKQSGGHIQLYSEIGRGTTARIYLPRLAEQDAPSVPPTGAPSPRGQETILVVEDNDQVRKTAVTQLTSLGYTVIEAANAEAALPFLERASQRIDLLFTDLVMPGAMGGYELALFALERRAQLRVLLTSGFPPEALRSSGKLKEDIPLLGKPYRRDELARAIRSALWASKGRARE